MRILDLFSGAGGFSCGFLDKGNTFVGVDKDDIALETYRDNIKGEAINADIIAFDPTTLGHFDVLIGSPPCQPHSTANRFKTGDMTLIKRYIEIRDAIKPRWWVMEEVTPVGKYGLFPPGFVHYQKACDYGLPHVRNRFYPGNYPPPEKHPYKGERFVTEDGHGTSYIPTVQTAGIQGFKYERERGYPSMEKLQAMIKTPIAAIRGYYHGQGDKAVIIKTAMAMISSPRTDEGGVDGSSRARETPEVLEYKELITPAFCARIMGFPEWYVFAGNKTQQYRQIGNAVCPPVAGAIWRAIKKVRMSLW